MRIKPIKVETVLIVAYLTFFLHVTNSVFYFNNRFHYFSSIIVGFIALGLILINKKYDDNVKSLFKYLVLPVILANLLSFVSITVFYKMNNIQLINQSLIRLLLYVSAFSLAVTATNKYEGKIIKYIIIAAMISYFSVLCKWVYYGIHSDNIWNIFRIFNNQINKVSLEVHGLTYIFGIILLYYILNNYGTKKNKYTIILLAFTIFIGNKRVIYLSFFVVLLFYFFFHKKRGDKYSRLIIRIVSLLISIWPLLFIYLIKNYYLNDFFNWIGVNDNSRLRFWNYFNESYLFNIFYLGKGIMYTDIEMAKTSVMYNLKINITTQIHNDVLRQYIGWGFIPFVYYYLKISYFYTKKILKEFNYDVAFKYLSILLYTIVMYSSDNMFVGIEYHFVFFVILILLFKNYDKKGEISKNEVN